jgi:ubiquinone/menaquinone biosynthesis C-methylase UbiE
VARGNLEMSTATAALGEWEAAEIARSAAEARHTPDERLRADPRQVARYIAPSRDTAYPLEYAYALLGDVAGQVVIDLGCGSGENTLLLARRGARVHATDISPDLLALARKRLEVNGVTAHATFAAGSAHQLAIADGSVDVVFGIAVLHHLDLVAAAREVLRVLKPGGRAIFQEPVRSSRLLRAVRRAIPYRAPDVSPFERPLLPSELREFAAGFVSIDARDFCLPFVSLADKLPVVQNAVHRYYRLDRWVLARLPSLAHFATIRVFQVVKGG